MGTVILVIFQFMERMSVVTKLVVCWSNSTLGKNVTEAAMSFLRKFERKLQIFREFMRLEKRWIQVLQQEKIFKFSFLQVIAKQCIARLMSCGSGLPQT